MGADQWASARRWISEGLSFIRSREQAAGAAGTTLDSSLAASLVRLDSSQVDDVASIGGGSPPYAVASSGVGKGELQRIQDLRAALLGSDGLLAALREVEPPDDGSAFG